MDGLSYACAPWLTESLSQNQLSNISCKYDFLARNAISYSKYWITIFKIENLKIIDSEH